MTKPAKFVHLTGAALANYHKQQEAALESARLLLPTLVAAIRKLDPEAVITIQGTEILIEASSGKDAAVARVVKRLHNISSKDLKKFSFKGKQVVPL